MSKIIKTVIVFLFLVTLFLWYGCSKDKNETQIQDVTLWVPQNNLETMDSLPNGGWNESEVFENDSFRYFNIEVWKSIYIY